MVFKPGYAGTPEERFWRKVDKNGPVFIDKDGVDRGPCWDWTASTSKNGYGKLWDGERLTEAHRFSYRIGVGPIPEGLVIDHLCRRHCCVNHGHLEPVTFGVNIARGVRRLPTHCRRGHLYTPETTRMIGKWRRCLTCSRRNDREYKRRSYRRKKGDPA